MLVIRTDANAAIGTGHVMRCLALAQAWQESCGDVAFVFGKGGGDLAHRVAAEGFECVHIPHSAGDSEDARATADCVLDRNARAVVLDGYHFGTSYQRRVRQTGVRLMVIDDYGSAGQYCADIILNQNLSASEKFYCSSGAHLLLGTDYVLLRREFVKSDLTARCFSAEGRRVLVTMGGSDPLSLTPRIVEVLKAIPGIEVTAVIASGDRRCAISGPNVKTVFSPPSMARLMAEADLAVTGSGSTCWELAFAGVPALLIGVAENQAGIGMALAREGVALQYWWHREFCENELVSAVSTVFAHPRRRFLSFVRGRRLVDGRGSRRVVEVLGAPVPAVTT